MARRLTGAFVALLLVSVTAPSAASGASFRGPTYSSPITLSQDGRYVWSVNPGADTVSVIRTSNNRVLRTIRVGDEPESVAVDPNNRYVYVANTAAGTVTVIQILDRRPRTFRTRNVRTFTTGAEPYNIVISPDGRRVFVANSGQDTISVIDASSRPPRLLGHVGLADSLCNDPDRGRHFQPRGLAVTQNNRRLYVTGFLAFTRPGGRQGDDNGKEGVVCRLSVRTTSRRLSDYRPTKKITLLPRITGFNIDSTGDGQPDPTSAFPNQLQSIVIRGNQAFLPNIAASPTGPLRFNVDTQAFVNVIDGVRTGREVDASAAKFLNLHLGARQPEPNKTKLFFANPWAIAFTNRGGTGSAYVVSAGSDLLVKVNVAADGDLANTVDADTTRYIDLNDPANAATAGANAGKNPQGIVINSRGTRAYVQNFVSRNVTVVDLRADRVIRSIRTAPLAPRGSQQQQVAVGGEVFFSSRGHFDKPAGITASTSNRLASEGWQSCSSCHFKGLTDGVVWAFGVGPRKSVPLNATFSPADKNDQRILNYSAIFDEVDDFELNIRGVSGPGNLATPVNCQVPPPATSANDPNHGLLIGDNGDFNSPPCVINAFPKPNAGRPQHTINGVPALIAMREWVRFAVRTPRGPFTSRRVRGGANPAELAQGRSLFISGGCASCHLGAKWTLSTKDFASPPAAAEIATETNPAPTFGAPVPNPYLHRFLRDIGSFNLGVPNGGNPRNLNIGAVEKASAAVVNGVAQPAPDALGTDYNNDGKGVGYNVPSLLGINLLQPYYHNGACESLACVVADARHRTANGTRPDGLAQADQQRLVFRFLQSIDASTPRP